MSSTHFRELKKDSKTKDGTATTCPRTCKVTFPFQPVERFRGSTAHTAFEVKTSSAIAQCRTILGELWAEGLSHNRNARKEELLEMLIKALPSLAEIFLTLAGPTEYESHDLVADFLSLYHTELLTKVLPCDLLDFITLYKRFHFISRPPEDTDVVFKRCFPESTATTISIMTDQSKGDTSSSKSPSK
jgi:hypothetical protein